MFPSAKSPDLEPLLIGDSRELLHSTVRNHAFPTLVDHFGGLYLVWREGSAHASFDGRLMMAESHDHGNTWTEPRLILSEEGHDYRDPNLKVLSDGTFILSYFVRQETPYTYHVWTRKSFDLGQTWSEPVLVSTMISACSAPVVQVNDLLFLPIYGNYNGYLYMSEDGGETWTYRSTILDNEEQHSEPWVVHYADEDDIILVALVRNDSTKIVTRRVSADLGLTWGDPRPIFKSDSRVAWTQSANGRCHAFYRDPVQNRAQVMTRSSDNAFWTWSPERHVHSASLSINNYTGFTEVASGVFAVVTAQQSANHSSSLYCMYATDGPALTPHGQVTGLPRIKRALMRGIPTIWDTFDRSDSVSGLGSAESGHAWTNNSSIKVVNRIAINTAPSGSATQLIEAYHSDFILAGEFLWDSQLPDAVVPSLGLIFRRIDHRNYMAVGLDGTPATGNEIKLVKVVGGVTTVLGTVPVDIRPWQWFELEVSAKGRQIGVNLDGVSILRHALVSSDLTDGKNIGIRMFGGYNHRCRKFIQIV